MLSIGLLGASGIAPAAVIRPVRRRDDVRIVAVGARSDPGAYARRHGIPRAHASYAALLADDEVELVYNALPPVAHAEWTVAALEAGKDVLCEKPFTMDAGQAQQVVDAAARTGRRVIEAFHDHYHPLAARVEELVAGGALGTVRSARAVFNGANPYDPASIRHDPALGGGALMDLGCYPVHWLRTLFGEPEVRGAEASLNPLGADLVIEAELAFASGVVATLGASMAEDVALESSLVVEGDRGRLEVQNMVFPSAGHSIRLEVDGVPRASTVAGDETYDHQLAAVLLGLATGERLPTEGQDSVDTMRVIDAVYSAAGMRA